MNVLCSGLRLIGVIFVVLSCTVAQDFLHSEEFKELMRYSNQVPTSKIMRISKRQAMRQAANPRLGGSAGAPPTLNTAANTVISAMSRVVGAVPQFFVEGRHYWPTEISLTKQFGLQGINELVAEVVEYDRTRALRAAREAACRQRDNCIWNQRFTAVTNIFVTATEEQRMMQKVDCNVVFAGCEHYH